MGKRFFLEVRLARVFGMSERVWRRHANPWSVYTRVPLLVPLVLAVWSRAWIGWWALLPVAVVAAFAWLNPRLFPPPADHNNWASQAVFGERVWLGRAERPIPREHERAAGLLALLSLLGLLPLVWGLAVLSPWPTLLGTVVVLLGKLWFCDRMAWLLRDMALSDPEYVRSLGYEKKG